NQTNFNTVKLLDGTLTGAHDGSKLKSAGALKVHFGPLNNSAEDYYYIEIGCATASALGIGLDSDKRHPECVGYTISTMSAAQVTLWAINEAIISKDKIRAALGALQNRLANTVTNLTIQAENLQAAESRISDVDVATEMTTFVRNQILSQAAVSMLAQANSLPRMALNLIG
ncbi:MAG: flagellin, partial [Deltaproteobacteria bacterium]|nr:flagellin [Deltaproteobacteria bacterium]